MKLIAEVCHRWEGIVCQPGDVFDLSEDRAAVWIRNGWARPLPETPDGLVVGAEERTAGAGAIETAAMEGAPEQALSRRGRRRPRVVDENE